MSIYTVGADTSILARAVLAEVSLCLTVASHKTWLANTVIVVDQLYTFLCPTRRARVG